MELILDLIRKYSGCCLNCGSLMTEAGCLCARCENALEHWEERKVSAPRAEFPVRSLYRWVPGRSDMLSKLILWLKGTRQKKSWNHYAKKFCVHSSQELPAGFKIYVVPAPSRRESEKDHAFLWAEALSKALGAELCPCLRKVGEYSQRGADRGTRALIEMEVRENYTDAVDLRSQILWIFADDIVTTGSTARAAHIALGRPTHFEVWTLAQRSLSCGASKDLL